MFNDEALRDEIIKNYYNNFLAEYFEVDKILKLIKRKYY